MKRLLVLVATVLGLLVLPAIPAGAAPEASCAVTWGSQPESAGPATSPSSEVRDIWTGRHDCYDRFVVDLDGPASGYRVRYVSVFRQDPSDQVIPLPGGAKIGLGISEKTVKTHLTSVFSALGVGDRVQAALWVERHRAELEAQDEG